MTKAEFRAQAQVAFENYLQEIEYAAECIKDTEDMLEDSVELLRDMEEICDGMNKEETRELIKAGKDDMPALIEEAQSAIYESGIEALNALTQEMFNEVTKEALRANLDVAGVALQAISNR